jgi:5'-methylthioadenosine phosphorylase
MTGQPEAILARELALCYTSIALVTDLDAGLQVGQGVSQEEVFRVFADNVERLRNLLVGVVERLPQQRACPCGHALDGIETGVALP